LFSPANPSGAISEDIDLNDIRIMYYNCGIPQSPYVAEEDIAIAHTPGGTRNEREATLSTRPETEQTAQKSLPEEDLSVLPLKSQMAQKSLPEEDLSVLPLKSQMAQKSLPEEDLSVLPLKSQMAVIKPRGRPETPTTDIGSGTEQAARKILPEDVPPLSATETDALQSQQSTNRAPNNSSPQDLEASSDYGTDSNRGTPYSDISDSCDEPENQNKNVYSQETMLPTIRNAFERFRQPAYAQQQVFRILCELRKNPPKNCKPIGFTHFKSFKNSNVDLTVGFLEPDKLGDQNVRCIRCNLCTKYFDPCEFLLHYDIDGVELDEKKCLLTEPQPAVVDMEPDVRKIWESMVTLKNILVGTRLKNLR
jgi:hypothetical protein